MAGLKTRKIVINITHCASLAVVFDLLLFYFSSLADYSGCQPHTPCNDLFPFQKLSFGGRQSNVSMTIVVFISCQFHSDVRSSLYQV